MARGDATILDMAIDGADMAALHRINRRCRLGIRPRWWWSSDRFRGLVREALRAKWSESAAVVKSGS